MFIAAGGCNNASQHVAAAEFPAPELVMVPQSHENVRGDADFEQDSWLYSRNDHRLGGLPGRDGVIIDTAEIRHREYLWNSNGRPHEHSTTYTRTLERRIGR
jgi:hypothetical protein